MIRWQSRSRARLLLSVLLLGAVDQSHGALALGDDSVLNETTFRSYQSAIELRPEERVWLRIPWRANLRTGIEDAIAQKKPMLLWLLNGHPLGCT